MKNNISEYQKRKSLEDMERLFVLNSFDEKRFNTLINKFIKCKFSFDLSNDRINKLKENLKENILKEGIKLDINICDNILNSDNKELKFAFMDYILLIQPSEDLTSKKQNEFTERISQLGFLRSDRKYCEITNLNCNFDITKSIDYEHKCHKIIISHKHINGKGGYQDSESNGEMSLAEMHMQNGMSDYILVFVYNGTYFDNNKKFNEKIKRYKNFKNIVFCHESNSEDVLKNLVK